MVILTLKTVQIYIFGWIFLPWFMMTSGHTKFGYKRFSCLENITELSVSHQIKFCQNNKITNVCLIHCYDAYHQWPIKTMAVIFPCFQKHTKNCFKSSNFLENINLWSSIVGLQISWYMFGKWQHHSLEDFCQKWRYMSFTLNLETKTMTYMYFILTHWMHLQKPHASKECLLSL